MSDTERTDDLSELRAELASLRAEVDRLKAHGAGDAPASASASASATADLLEPSSAVTRRNWMKAAAAAALGGTAVALGTSERVAAANGDNLRIGNLGIGGGGVQTATGPTQINYTGDEDVAFVVQSGTGFSATNSSIDAAIGGWTTRTQNPVGVYGYSSVGTANGYGVLGRSDGSAGVEGRGSLSSVAGVRGVGGSQAPGVEGTGRDGLVGNGSRYGAMIGGNLAALSITTRNITAPPERFGRTHEAGSVDTSTPPEGTGNSDLWACVSSGAPGTWRRLAGPGTAGSLTPIDPVRVYDSRRAAPFPGLLQPGQFRVVYVADARDLGDGTVVTADVIPAGATAVAYNVTVDGTVNQGFLAVTPGDTAAFSASTINWSASGSTLANGGIVKLDATRNVKVFCGGTGGTNFIIDITGYYL